MPRKGRRAVKAARAREKALKAEGRMDKVLRGKELTKVQEFVVAHLKTQKGREDTFTSMLDGKQVAEELRRWCKGQTKLEVTLDIMMRECRPCGAIKWDCVCGMFWGDGEREYPEQQDQMEWDGDEEEWTDEDEDDEYEGFAAELLASPDPNTPLRKAANPEGAVAMKQKKGGQRALFASK